MRELETLNAASRGRDQRDGAVSRDQHLGRSRCCRSARSRCARASARRARRASSRRRCIASLCATVAGDRSRPSCSSGCPGSRPSARLPGRLPRPAPRERRLRRARGGRADGERGARAPPPRRVLLLAALRGRAGSRRRRGACGAEPSFDDRVKVLLSTWLLPALMALDRARRLRATHFGVRCVHRRRARGPRASRVTVLPFMLAILVAVGLFRASGALDALAGGARAGHCPGSAFRPRRCRWR